MPAVCARGSHQALRIDTSYPAIQQPLSSDGLFSDTSPSNLTASGSTPSTGTSDWAICHVVCNFDFESPDPDQLSFSKDEVLAIIKQEDSGWWAAMRPEGDRIGWIPSSFVEPLPEWRLDEMVLKYEPGIPRAFDDEREMDVDPHNGGDELWIPFEDLKLPPMQIVDPTDIILPHDADHLRDHSIDSFAFTDCVPLPLDIITPSFPLSSTVPRSSVLQGLAPHVTQKSPFRCITLKNVSQSQLLPQ
ncbi:SH3 domain-containing protein [Pisolithus marmoratus]|nr:SH3 domain-containing protein [Pisolithus marmoratus]